MQVMISQPMAGLTEQEIRKNRAEVVALLESQGHEVVDTIFEQNAPASVNAPLRYLGKSFQAMAAVDAVYFMDGWEKARGCRLEYEPCKAYGVTLLNAVQDECLGKYIGYVVGSIFSLTACEEIAKHAGVGTIKTATIDIRAFCL